MPKTQSKRKADAVTFEDDDEEEGSSGGSGSDENEANGDGASSDENDAKTPKANTPTKEKTPGSSGGMKMRSGRKKKRSKPDAASASAVGAVVSGATPLKKRAKRSSSNANDGEVGEDMEQDEDDDTAANEQNGKSNKSEYSGEDEDMATEEDEEKKSEEKASPREVPPETTREAVAAAQVTVTESTVDEEEGTEETTTANNNNGVPPNNGSSGGVGGILRLVTQKLRLPSQHTPKPPAQSVAAAAESASPAPPPGGRRLIFETAQKKSATVGAATAGGGRNKLLMQTRHIQGVMQNEEPRSTQREHFQRRAQSSEPTAASASTDTCSATTEPSFLNHELKRDVVLYTKAWFVLILLCYVSGNVLSGLSGDNVVLGGRLSTWNVKEQSARWVNYYGVEPTTSNAGGVEDNDVPTEAEEEEDIEIETEIITKTVTVTDPNLLSAAHAKIRAHRMNLHDIRKLEEEMKAVSSGLELLEGSVAGWSEEYPTFDFGKEVSKNSESAEKGGRSSGKEKSAAEKIVARDIAANDIVIFSKSYCPHCKATKELFNYMKFNGMNGGNGEEEIPLIQVIELDHLPNGPDLQDALFKFTGQKTVPNVFVRGRHLGGNDDTQSAAKSGALEELLGMPMYEPPADTESDDKENDGDRQKEKPSFDKIDEMRSSIAKQQDTLMEWDWVLGGVEKALDALNEGVIGPKEMNGVIAELSEISMVPSEAMVLDVTKIITLPGEGCEGMDYIPLKQEEEEEAKEEDVVEDEEEEEIVEVVGGIDVHALDYASDAPVRYEDAQTAYESLLKLAQSTNEALVGAATNGPSPHASKWVNQIILEELHKKGVDDKPPPIDELYKPLSSEPTLSSAASSAGIDSYTAKDAVRDIDRMLEIEDADRTGKFDYASVIHGARVLRRGPYATSYSLYETLPLFNRMLAYTKLRFYGHPPEVALLPTFPMHARGQCWSFANEFTSSRSRRQGNSLGMANDDIGEYATLTVSLSSAITVTEIMVEHISPGFAKDPTTAINEFRVLGFEDGGSFGAPWELGTFRFDIGPTIQAFSIPTTLDEGQSVPKLKAISIAVDSNWGAKYSCLYRVRVHGA